MSSVIWIAIIAAAGSIIAAWMSHRTHKAVNSTMAAMVELVRRGAKAEGVKEESDRRDLVEGRQEAERRKS